MHRERPFALFISWTYYGTWLPGDERGHVSNTWSNEPSWQPKENTPGTPYRADDWFTRNSARNRQKHPTVQLDREQANCVATSLIEVAQRHGWRILRAAIMGNHVHVLVTDCPDDGPAVRRILKGNTQAALSRTLGHAGKWWTKGGSDRYLKSEQAISDTADYIRDQSFILAQIIDMQVIPGERRG